MTLAENLGNYAEIFDCKTVYSDLLPMLFRFLSDPVARVACSSCKAMAPIIIKFAEDEQRQACIVRILKKKFLRSKTYKKRQHFILMCHGPLMMEKAIFEKYFKHDFLSLVGDRVINVRILLAQALRHHFLKEINGTFVEDQGFNEAVLMLKQDRCDEVRLEVEDIETVKPAEKAPSTVEEFLQSLEEASSHSDTTSMSSEDELAIESEIMRHDSEDEMDHGPVLASLREQRNRERQEEENRLRIEKSEREGQE